MAGKFNNRKTIVDGIEFASRKEANRYGELKVLRDAGAISSLQLQVRYKLKVNGCHICDYIADFVYMRDGQPVTEDVKGRRTPVYSLKAKLMRAVHGITILET